MISLKGIAYNDCDVVKRYGKALDDCNTLDKLKKCLIYWKPLAEDAYKIVQDMDEKRFNKFVKALKMERKGEFANNEDCTIIALPMPMFKVAQTAHHFHVPFGCALHRMINEGVFNQH